MNFPTVKIKFILLFLIGSFFRLNGQLVEQPGGFRHITVRDGLPSSEVYKLFQDKMGYMWMCTDAGVCRYNGYNFQSFTTRNGLTDNTVFKMTEDSKGKIWAQGFSGALSYFDGKKFNPIKANDQLVELYSNGQKSSFCMSTDENGGIIIGGFFTHGLFKLVPEDNYGSITPVKPSGVAQEMQMIWTTTQKSNNYYAAIEPNGKWANFFHNGIISTINFNSQKGVFAYYQCFKDHRGNLIFSIDNYLYCIDSIGGIIMKEFSAPIVTVGDDKENNLWISMFFGGTAMIPGGDITAEPKIYLAGKTVSCVFEDNERGYWFSTVGDGVYYLPDIRFGYLTASEGLAKSNVQSVAAFRKNELVIGLPNGTISLFNPEKKGEQRLYTYNSPVNTTLPTESILTIGDSIIGSVTGIQLFDSTLKVVNAIKSKGHFKGVIRNPTTGEIMFFTPASLLFVNSNFNIDSTQNTKIRFTAACYGNDGTIWLGALNGLWKMVGNLPIYMGDSSTGVKARIDGICQDKNGVLWIATRGEGVFAICNGKKWHFGEEDGMAANTCRSIALDPANGIWVGTNHGITYLSNFEPLTGKAKLRSFNTSHGLLSDEVKFIIFHNKILWMGSNEGICWIGVNDLVKDTVAPPIYITKVLFGKEECNLDTLSVFDFSDKTIRIFVEGVSFRDPEGIRYKYRMIGGDEQWITTANREISFSSLSPGDYQLEIVAVNADGQQSDHPAIFSFFIRTPFYRTIWFLSVVIVLLILLVWAGAIFTVRRKQKRVEEKAETERRIAELRLSALRAQMNPHFIFNAINSIQHFVLQNESESAYNYLAKFSSLIRMVLDQSQSETISLEQELKMLNLYIELEQLRFERPFTFEIYVDRELKDENIKIPGMLVQPFVENAIWHGLLTKKEGHAWLKIAFLKKDGYAEISIEDNGIGRPAAASLKQGKEKRQSYGLQITEERLRLSEEKHLDQPTILITDLKDNKGNAVGTKVVINIELTDYED